MSIDWDAVIAELSKPGGWIKGDMGFPNLDAPVCLYGAMCRVAGEGERGESVVAKVIREQFPDRAYADDAGWEVPAFNDHPNTTLADVIAVCEKARAES